MLIGPFLLFYGKSACIIATTNINQTRSLGGAPGPNFELVALRASLTSSFAPVGRSGRVTHATMWSLEGKMTEMWKKMVKKSKNCVEKYIKVVEKTRKISGTNPKNITDKSKKYHGQIQKISRTNLIIFSDKSENFPDKSENFPRQI